MPTALAKRVFGDTSFGKWIPFLRAKINQMAIYGHRDWDGMAMGKAMATHEQCATMLQKVSGGTFRFQLRSKVLVLPWGYPLVMTNIAMENGYL